jgi:hypothetical protein
MMNPRSTRAHARAMLDALVEIGRDVVGATARNQS